MAVIHVADVEVDLPACAKIYAFMAPLCVEPSSATEILEIAQGAV